MKVLQILLILQFIGIVVYTALAGMSFGWNLQDVFIDNLTALNWSGQFNYDFLCYLLLSGIWVAWRNNFSISGMLLGAVASIMGIFFFAPYLLVLITQNQGEVLPILLGNERANAIIKQ